MSDTDTFLVVGLGNFGHTVAKHALQSGHKLKLYLRLKSIEKRKQQIDELTKLGSVELFVQNGSGDTKITFTTLDDIGRLTVKTSFDERTKNTRFTFMEMR